MGWRLGISSSVSIFRTSSARSRAAFNSNLGIEICPLIDIPFEGTDVLPLMKAMWIFPSSVMVLRYVTYDRASSEASAKANSCW